MNYIYDVKRTMSIGVVCLKTAKSPFPIFGHINFYHEEHEGHEG